MKSFFIIVNPNANEGQSQLNWLKVQAKLDEQNIDYQVVFTKKNGDAFKLAFRFTSHQTTISAKKWLVLVVGGDGTLNDVLNGIKSAKTVDIPLAFIPSGSNNGFASGIGIATDPLLALQQVLDCSEASYYDIGSYVETTHAKQGYFLNDFGVGIDAYIVSLNQRPAFKETFTKLHLPFIPYIINLFKAYVNQEAFAITVRIGSKYEFYKHAFLVNIANHPYYDGEIVLSPKANATDHQLDLLIVENMSFLKFILFSVMMRFQKQTDLPFVHHYKNKDIHLIINSLEYGQVDGEETGSQYYDLYFNAKKYPFWMDIQSIPVKERK
ncbi:YegS/Rv2252/BmrU family lipid kinase [Ligilactobacillus sp. Marseille-Q7487]|uniref:diacylglycerol/lipid kinase family protein n=1 Tax=Ligilactobacillus sp. Marseille-Q7487 TaxID=3022128 RepID=UPI0015B4C47F|nr:YegS/Rv2252/BmrU family lipid kinase [Ligilactobacillus sp. Marseille-Q7487]